MLPRDTLKMVIRTENTDGERSVFECVGTPSQFLNKSFDLSVVAGSSLCRCAMHFSCRCFVIWPSILFESIYAKGSLQ